MDSEVRRILVANEKLITKLKVSLPQVIQSLGENRKFRYTSKALLSFISRAGYLNSAVIQLSETKNIYSIACLYRSIIEHNFRHLYIYTKALKTNSDAVGISYCQILKSSEDLEWFDKVNKYSKSHKESNATWNTKGEHNKSIRESKREFLFSEIVEYLKKNSERGSSEIQIHLNVYLLKRIEEYNDLSAVVHGGPSANSGLERVLKDRSVLGKRLDKFITDSFYLYKSLIETTYLFAYLINGNNQKYYTEIKNIEL